MIRKLSFHLNRLLPIATISGLGSILIDSGGFGLSVFQRGVVELILLSSAILFISDPILKLILSRFKPDLLRELWIDVTLISSLLLSAIFYATLPVSFEVASHLQSEGYIFIAKFYIICVLVLKLARGIRRLISLRVHPAQVAAISFALVIGLGTLLLLMPRSVAPDKSLSFIDALFTATSATCVTGLVVVDTGTHFSLFGQIVILSLIQVGGLGIMTITAFFAVVAGEMGMGERSLMKDLLDSERLGKLSNLIISILILTLAFEAIGAAFLYLNWASIGDFRSSNQLIYYSIFHSISAFCNAGFSLFEDSMVNYRSHIGINMVVSILIVSGGIGFTVLENLINSKIVAKIRRKKRRRLSVHTRLVLITSAVLIVAGWILILVLEWDQSLYGLSFKDKVMASYFQSVTTRTAGFNTIDTGALSASCYILMTYLMFIGASPGSCGGGIKTSTFATLLGALYAMLRGRESVDFFKRTIPNDMVNRALVIVVISLMLIATFAIILTNLQDDDPLKVLFELVSAFGTVGLSANLTPKLSDMSRLLIIITMFVGRVGPLTLALALKHERKVNYEYPEERIMIG